MEWYKTAGLAIAGIFGGERLHHYATRTLAEKARIGDIASVRMVNLSPTNTLFGEQAFARLKIAVQATGNVSPNPTIPVMIMNLETPQSDRSIRISGNVQGQEVLGVTFAGSSIEKLLRNGIQIQPGYDRIY